MAVIETAADAVTKCRGSKEFALCVLGAGNCNDIDIRRLLEFCKSIALVDVDRESVAAGVERQVVPASVAEQRITINAPFDLSGVLSFRGDRPTLHEERASDVTLARKLTRHLMTTQLLSVSHDSSVSPNNLNFGLPIGAFGVVASTCVLSQLVRQVTEIVGLADDEVYTLSRLVASLHVELVANLLVPGGVGIVVTDFADESVPVTVGKSENGPSANAPPQRRDFVHLKPMELQAHLATAYMQQRVEGICLSREWPWDLAAGHRLMCGAITFVRSWPLGSTPLTPGNPGSIEHRLRAIMRGTGIPIQEVSQL